MAIEKGAAIPVKEKLQERYLIKEILGENGFSITYRGYDCLREKKVIIKELFPSKIVRRVPGENYKVECITFSHEGLFETMKEQVINEAKTLIQLFPLRGIANVITCFEENQTVYTISEYIEGSTLESFLGGKKASKLPLNSLMLFFEPMIRSLRKLHNAGIVHGKIRPDQIIVTKKNGAMLVGFCDPMRAAIDPVFVEAILPVRDSRYTPVELFMEQGVPTSATDIYGLAATIYYCITGIIPPHFYDRIQNTEGMKEPYELGVALEKSQSEAIMKGIASHDFERYQNIDDFLEGLVEQEEEDGKKEKKPPKPIILYREPFVFLKRKNGINIRDVVTVVVLLAIICIIPPTVGIVNKYQTQNFYEEFVSANEYDRCMLLRNLAEKKRSRYTNNYNTMETGKKTSVKYYDLEEEKVISKNDMDTLGKGYRYLSVDYRNSQKAMVSLYESGVVTTWEINLLKTEEYFQVTKRELENGKVVSTTKLKILPGEDVKLP
ncbi:MAG: protein kinase [Lachnospiraceae bacterium]|nr:protein kinase [Lachnospiraceae bacterium]